MRRSRRRAGVVFLGAVVLAAVGIAAAWPHGQPTVSHSAAGPAQPPAFRGAAIPAGKLAPDFRLTTEQGRPLELSRQQGKLVLLAFLYTRCRDVCPLIATELDSVVRALGPRASSVRILAVSVDPRGDTGAAARAYLRSHHLGPDFHWLLGTRQQLWPVWRSYDVAVSPDQDSESIAHTAPVLLLDRAGRPRVYYQELHTAAVAHDLRLLLASSRRAAG